MAAKQWVELLAVGAQITQTTFREKGSKKRHEVALAYVNSSIASAFMDFSKPGVDTGCLELRMRKGDMVPSMAALASLREMGLELRSMLATVVDAYTTYAAVVAAVDEVHCVSLPDLPTSYGRLHLRFRRCRKRKTKWKCVDKASEKCVASVQHLDTLWMKRLNAVSKRVYGCSICLSDISTYMDVAQTATTVALPEELLYSDNSMPGTPKSKKQRCEIDVDVEVIVISDDDGDDVVLERKNAFSIPRLEENVRELTQGECKCRICKGIYTYEQFMEQYYTVVSEAAKRYGAPPHEASSLDDGVCPLCIAHVQCMMCFEAGRTVLDICTCDGHLLYTGGRERGLPTYIKWNVLTRNYPLEGLPRVDGWSRKWGERYIDYLPHPIGEEFIEEQEYAQCLSDIYGE